MSNKLVKGDASTHDDLHGITILSPIPFDDVLCSVTVMISKRTREVELSVNPGSMLEKGGMAQDVLQLGLQRLRDIQQGHEEKQITLPN